MKAPDYQHPTEHNFLSQYIAEPEGEGGAVERKVPTDRWKRDAPPSLPLLLQVLLKTLLSHNWPDATRCLTFDSNPNTFKIKYENFTKVPGGKMGENGFVARRRERPGGEKRFEGCQDWPRPARKKVPGPLIVLAWLRWTYAGRQKHSAAHAKNMDRVIWATFVDCSKRAKQMWARKSFSSWKVKMESIKGKIVKGSERKMMAKQWQGSGVGARSVDSGEDWIINTEYSGWSRSRIIVVIILYS